MFSWVTKIEISTTSGHGGTACTLLDKPLGFKCLAALLGVGSMRLDKKAAGTPDLRFGKRQHQSKPGSWSVDAFLQIAYDAVAETLPDEFLVPFFIGCCKKISIIISYLPALLKELKNIYI